MSAPLIVQTDHTILLETSHPDHARASSCAGSRSS